MKYISKMNDTKVNSMSFRVEYYTSEQKMQAITLLPLQWHLQPFLLNSVRQKMSQRDWSRARMCFNRIK